MQPLECISTVFSIILTENCSSTIGSQVPTTWGRITPTCTSPPLSTQTSALERQSIDLDKLHLATGRVSLASVVRMLITEFGIATRRHDRAEVLDHAERIFQEELGQPV
jgi:hypothetical protein